MYISLFLKIGECCSLCMSAINHMKSSGKIDNAMTQKALLLLLLLMHTRITYVFFRQRAFFIAQSCLFDVVHLFKNFFLHIESSLFLSNLNLNHLSFSLQSLEKCGENESVCTEVPCMEIVR